MICYVESYPPELVNDLTPKLLALPFDTLSTNAIISLIKYFQVTTPSPATIFDFSAKVIDEARLDTLSTKQYTEL